ncbi:MAG: GNAT family N-acetyltransferase [Rikenellaceae bacterium]
MICKLIYESALQRGTGIAKRSPEYIADKITSGKAVVAICGEKLVGFSYIETWGHGDYVATSGLIVDPTYRHLGLAARIKAKTFDLARKKYPRAKLFSITTSLPVMKLNSKLGYTPVTFSELTDDEEFWKGCEGCKNYDILQRNERRMCLCTGMLYDPKSPKNKQHTRLLPYTMLLKNKIQKIFNLK